MFVELAGREQEIKSREEQLLQAISQNQKLEEELRQREEDLALKELSLIERELFMRRNLCPNGLPSHDNVFDMPSDPTPTGSTYRFDPHLEVANKHYIKSHKDDSSSSSDTDGEFMLEMEYRNRKKKIHSASSSPKAALFRKSTDVASKLMPKFMQGGKGGGNSTAFERGGMKTPFVHTTSAPVTPLHCQSDISES